MWKCEDEKIWILQAICQDVENKNAHPTIRQNSGFSKNTPFYITPYLNGYFNLCLGMF